MSTLLRSFLLLTVSLSLAGCGEGSMPAPTPVGIFVQSTPANQTAYAAMAPPQNQVSFAPLSLIATARLVRRRLAECSGLTVIHGSRSAETLPRVPKPPRC